MNSRLIEMALSGVIEGQDDFPRRCSVQGELEGVRALGGQVIVTKQILPFNGHFDIPDVTGILAQA